MFPDGNSMRECGLCVRIFVSEGWVSTGQIRKKEVFYLLHFRVVIDLRMRYCDTSLWKSSSRKEASGMVDEKVPRLFY
jgi:hypothetical protein